MLVNLKPEAPLKLNETFIAFIILILMIITASERHLFPAGARTVTEVDDGGLSERQKIDRTEAELAIAKSVIASINENLKFNRILICAPCIIDA
jgi:hypothetical protein